MYASKLKRTADFQIIYLAKDKTSLKKRNSGITEKIKPFTDECSCMSHILSTTGKMIYFVISATMAKTVIPLIHDYLCVEHIYIETNNNNTENSNWKYSFSKLRGSWPSIEEIWNEVEKDILMIEADSSNWADNTDIFGHLWTQQILTSTTSLTADEINQADEEPIIIILCTIQPIPFRLNNDSIETHVFTVTEDYHRFMNEQKISGVFLVIIDDDDTKFDDIETLTKYDIVHGVYLFLLNNIYNTEHKLISPYEHIKTNGIFYLEHDLSVQLTEDICFFRQTLTNTPRMSILKIECDILSTLDEKKTTFLSFQFFTAAFKQLCSAPDVPPKISEYIIKNSMDLSSDLYENNIQLTSTIDRIIKQFNPDMLLKASSHFGFINEYLESSLQKICPLSMTIYRAQLVSTKDLKTIQSSKNCLLALHTLVFTSRSYSSTKRICRQATKLGLTTVLFEINIPKGAPLTYLDSDTIAFPISTIFKIVSTAKAPDNIIHIQMELADSSMYIIREQLSNTVGGHITWLTFGNYLARIKQFDAAEKYFNYFLETIPLDTQQRAAIYNNLGAVYLLMDGKREDSSDCLQKARDLIGSNKVKADEREIKHSKRELEVNNEAEQYVKLAEEHEQENDYIYACFFYEKALQFITDPVARNNYQLKIETLNIKINEKQD